MRLLLYNGMVYCGEENIHDWVLASDGNIIAIGKGDGYKDLCNGEEECIDLLGRFVLPGFYDSHVHLVQTGIDMLSLNLNSARSIGEVLEMINEYSTKLGKGKLVRAIGFDDMRVAEGRMPTRYELDYCAPNNPVWINRVEYHISVFNTLALNKLSIPFNIEGLKRDERNLPDGLLYGAANALARRRILESLSDDLRREGVELAIDVALSKGVTTINAMEGGYNFCESDFGFLYRNSLGMPIDIELFYQSLDVSKVLKMGLRRIGGDIFVDGSFGSRTAALSEDYSDLRGRGELYFSEEELSEFVDEAHQAGLDVSLHAIGDRAIEIVLNAYEKVIKSKPRDHRHRIEHFELANDRQIERVKELGIIVSMQPTFEHYWGEHGGMYEERLGIKRANLTNRFRLIKDKGIIIAGGSDSDVTPIDPMLGVHYAVNHPKSDYALDISEALKLFTENGAYAIGEQDKKGRIKVGYLADMCVLDSNPLTTPKNELKNIRVCYTIKEGNVIYKGECNG